MSRHFTQGCTAPRWGVGWGGCFHLLPKITLVLHLPFSSLLLELPAPSQKAPSVLSHLLTGLVLQVQILTAGLVPSFTSSRPPEKYGCRQRCTRPWGLLEPEIPRQAQGSRRGSSVDSVAG